MEIVWGGEKGLILYLPSQETYRNKVSWHKSSLTTQSWDLCSSAGPTLCAVSANCWALFFRSSVFSSARPNRSPRSFKAWLAFCTALVTLSAAEWRMLFPEEGQQEHQKLTYSADPCRGGGERGTLWEQGKPHYRRPQGSRKQSHISFDQVWLTRFFLKARWLQDVGKYWKLLSHSIAKTPLISVLGTFCLGEAQKDQIYPDLGLGLQR